MDGQGTTWRKNIAENFNRLSREGAPTLQTTDRQTTDGPFAKNAAHSVLSLLVAHKIILYLIFNRPTSEVKERYQSFLVICK